MRASPWPELSVERIEWAEGLFPEKSAMFQLHFVSACLGPCAVLDGEGQSFPVLPAELWVIPPNFALQWRVGVQLSRFVITLAPASADRTLSALALMFDTALAPVAPSSDTDAAGAPMRLAEAYFSGISEVAAPLSARDSGPRRLFDPSMPFFAEIARAQPRSEHDARFAMAFGQMLLSHLAAKTSHLEPSRESEDSGEDAAMIAALRSFVDERLGYDLGVDDLARNAQMSKFQLLRLMKKHLAQTPQQFVIQRRIEKAKHLLRSSEHSLADIAFQTGFSSQSHLSNTFKQIVGNTPKGFRDGVPNSG